MGVTPVATKTDTKKDDPKGKSATVSKKENKTDTKAASTPKTQDATAKKEQAKSTKSDTASIKQVEEPTMVASKVPVSGDKGNPHYAKELEQAAKKGETDKKVKEDVKKSESLMPQPIKVRVHVGNRNIGS